MKDLKIQIPREFKEQIEQRFLYENRKLGVYYALILVANPLCEKFLCDDCPFGEWAHRENIPQKEVYYAD